MAVSRDIQYRRMVSNIARELNAADVEQIAYVRLTGREDTTKYSAANPTASALDLLKNLERRGDFSVKNNNGLKEVVMDASRKDLVDKINDFGVQESTKHKCLQKLNFVKTLPRSKGRQKKDVLPMEELAGKFQDREQWVLVGGDERKAAQTLQRSEIAQELTQTSQDSREPPTLATKGGSGSPSVQKKKPLLPPTHKKTSHETASEPHTPTQQQQQQMVLSVQYSQFSPNKSPTLRPSPVPPPKLPKSHHLVQDVEKSEMDRDSGMWTGSLSEDVAEWTKHRTTSKSDCHAGLIKSSDYQCIGETDQKDHDYTDLQ